MTDATSRWARMARVSEAITEQLKQLANDKEREDVCRAFWEANRPKRERRLETAPKNQGGN